MDIVTSLKALHKIVDGQQLTSDLGGTYLYNHSDWLHFHQVLMNDWKVGHLPSSHKTLSAKVTKFFFD